MFADFHRGYTNVPSFNHLLGSECETERFAAVLRRIELFSGHEPSCIVYCNFVSDFGAVRMVSETRNSLIAVSFFQNLLYYLSIIEQINCLHWKILSLFVALSEVNSLQAPRKRYKNRAERVSWGRGI